MENTIASIEAPLRNKGTPHSQVEKINVAAAIAFALALTVCHLMMAVRAGLHPTEAYYWLWSRYPTISYYDHPPMVAWWIWVGTHLFGATPLGIRIPTILSVLATSATVYATGRILFDQAVAARAVLWFNATLLAAVGGFVATPDAPCTLFWALAFLAFAILVKTGRGACWLMIGLLAGLGAISKYTDLFFGLGILSALVIDRDLRHWFASLWLWAGGLLALVVFLPVVLWNYQHNWASFALQFGRVAPKGFAPHFLGEYVGGQIALLNPFVAVFAAAAIGLLSRKPAVPWRREIGLSVATVAPMLIYMLVHSTHERVDGGWLAPVYPALALASAAAAQSFAGEKRWRAVFRFVRLAAAPFGAAAALCVLWLLYDPPAKMLFHSSSLNLFNGWPQFARDADSMRRMVGANWIATNDYTINAELSFYLRDSNEAVEQISQRIRYGFAPPPDTSLLMEPALLLLRGGWADPINYANCFQSVKKLGVLQRRGFAGNLQEPIEAFRVDRPALNLFQAGCDGLP